MPFIKKDYIQNKLLPAVSIEEVIEHYVKLKKQGVNYTCCCPFHNEKTPSFVVSPSKGIFKCFGCGVSGNALDFVVKYKNLTFVDGVEELARLVGSTVEYEESLHSSKYNTNYAQYYELMDRVCQLYIRYLNENKEAFSYFKDKRGLSFNTITKSRLGFAPLENDHLAAFSDDEKKLLVELGVLKKSDKYNSYYPFMRNRVIIPILDIKGRVIAFGGRTLNNELPKYLNTAETRLFKKSKELYGLYNVLTKNNNRPDKIVIVEGYMDVISLEQANFNKSVASLGTATTEEHFKTMFRYTDKIICLYDGDNAGQNAALKACSTVASVVSGQKEVRFAFLPKEHDPDSLVREHGIDAINSIVDDSMSYPEFIVYAPSLKYDLTDLGNGPKYINTVLELISHIKDDALRLVCLNVLSKKINVDVSYLQNHLEQLQDKAINREAQRNYINRQNKLEMTPIRKIISFILQEPTIVARKYDDFALDKFIKLIQKGNIKGVDFLCSLLLNIKENRNENTATLIEKYRDTPYEKIVNLLIDVSLTKITNLSFEHKVSHFYDLIKLNLFDILKLRCNTISNLNNYMTDNLMREYELIQTFINKN